MNQEQKDVLALLSRASAYIENNLEGSSPATRQFRSKVVEQVSSLHQRISSTASSTASGTSSGKRKAQTDSQQKEKGVEGKLEKLLSDKHTKSVQAAQKQFEKLLAVTSLPPLTCADFIQNLRAIPVGNHHVQEDAAFARLLRGYDANTQSEWMYEFCDALCPSVESAPLLHKIRLTRENSVLPVDQRLTALQRAIEFDERASAALRFSQFVLEQISCAEFAFAWKSLAGADSKLQKAAFYTAAYQDQPEHQSTFKDLTQEKRDELMQTLHAVSYEKWRKKTETHVTARNRWVDLFDTFGVALLMDPFWRVNALIPGKTSCEFGILFKLLLDNIPADGLREDANKIPIPQLHYRGSWKALMGSLIAFDLEFGKFVNDFLDVHVSGAHP
ncbi:hypothetical protein FB451DRAFT_1400915 [Mycena latifolia]|nr:hypothetical protein FB451DRAFT_1400915 [Mycena latifolia]